MAPWLFLVFALTAHTTASTTQCVIFDTPEELWAASDLVFLGTVVATKPTGIQGFHVTVEIVTFRVDKAWKGKLDKVVHVGGDAPFEKDRQYLVFAAGKRPSTSLPCGSAEPAERAKAKLEWLAKR